MENALTVTLLQLDLHWQNPPANCAAIEARLAQVPIATDLIVLPEMFSTGFSLEAAALAEPMHGPTVAWMQRTAAAFAAVVTGSLIIRDEAGHYRNRLLWVRPDGSLDYYDKRHLFGFAHEPDHYAPGTARLVQEWRGWRICPLVCYDLRFPVWSRNTPAQPYDLLLYVANWPAARRTAWNALLRARAIENVAYCLGVNRVGTDGPGHDYVGDSAVVNMRGDYLVQAGNVELCLTRTLSLKELQDFRAHFPALEDADAFELL